MSDDRDDARVRQALKEAFRVEGSAELDRDLWPRMRERMAARPQSPSRLDWALLAILAGAAAAFPNLLLGVLYNL